MVVRGCVSLCAQVMDLTPLGALRSLVSLDASRNRLDAVLDFRPPRADRDGDTGVAPPATIERAPCWGPLPSPLALSRTHARTRAFHRR